MKRLLTLVLCACLLVFCAACASDNGSSPERTEPTTEMPTAAPLPEDARVLVAYFSWADNAILDDNVDAVSSPSVLPPGNVQQLAEWVQAETAGDLFVIRVAEPYPSDWDACLDRAHDERGEDARPALAESVANIDDYDVVFLGYPNWWYGVPMPLLTFLEENDLSDKQVYLFRSHGTGGLANSVEIITEAIPDTTISDNIFHCYEEDASSSQNDIQAWLSELGF